MKKLTLVFALVISSFINAQNIIEVSISKLSKFGTFGQDSLHLMIQNTVFPPINEMYVLCNQKLIFNLKSKKLFRFTDNKSIDTLSIKKFYQKDSIYTFIFNEIIYDSGDGEYVTYADTYIVLDTRKNPINKKVPLLCYYWYWEINDNSKGYVSDYIQIKSK